MKIAYISTVKYIDPFYIKLKEYYRVDKFTYYNEIVNPDNYDVLFVEYLGISAILASQKRHKNLIVRTRGVEIYESNLSEIVWENINWLLAMQPHQIDYFKRRYSDYEPKNFGLLSLAAPLIEFSLNSNSGSENKVALVANITGRKGFDHIPEILLKYPQLSIYHLGKPMKYGHPVEEFVRWRLEKDGTSDRYVYQKWRSRDALPGWLEDKKYILLPSISEGFCRAMIEGMCKGLKPIIRNWAGAENIWSKESLYDRVEDIQKILDSSYEPNKYRKYVEDRYSPEVIINQFKKYI